MVFVVLVIFVFSLLGIIGLFILKSYELRSQVRFARTLREEGDMQALALKRQGQLLTYELKKIAPTSVLVLRWGIHRAALGTAYSARAVERGAHAVADRISHKHSFALRETQSDFLKEVTDHKKGITSQESTDSI
jgi:hypothetical protein